MAEYIEREAAIKLLHYNADESCSSVVADFETLPTTNVAPVVYGHWIKEDTGVIRCSKCGEEHEWQDYRASYCDTCGAKMEEAR